MNRQLTEIQRLIYDLARRQPHRPLERLTRYVTDWTVLKTAWRQARQGKGSTQVPQDRDGTASQSVRGLLLSLADDVQSGRYRPGPVHRFSVAKPGAAGESRPVAMLNLRDRTLHAALKLVLEPIIEARLGRQCFGFRPGRDRFDQLQTIRRRVEHEPDQFGAALTADIASCFDRLDHRLLREDFRRLVCDPALERLFEGVLTQVGAGVAGWWRRRHVGVLQGSPLSPLLANWNLARFDSAWKKLHGDNVPMLRYADDLIVLAETPAHAKELRATLVRCLRCSNRLELKTEKTWFGTFDEGVRLLGLVVRLQTGIFDTRPRCRILLDPKRFSEVATAAERLVAKLDSDRPLDKQFEALNQRLRGWFEAWQFAYDAPQAFSVLDERLLSATRRRLKEMLGCSAAQLDDHHGLVLASGHRTWQADGVSILVLSALPRRAYRARVRRYSWEAIEQSEPKTVTTAPRPMLELNEAPSVFSHIESNNGHSTVQPENTAMPRRKKWRERRPIPSCEVGVLHAFGPGTLHVTNGMLEFVGSDDDRRMRIPLRELHLVCFY